MRNRIVRSAPVGVLLLVLGIQLVPYGRNHSNPPVRVEPAWDSQQTHDLTVRACYDCHSNQTSWPWYSNIAPVSWLIQRDLEKGRREVNFSEWDRPQREAGESGESIQKGKMPPAYYTVLHPEAKLTPSEQQALIRGIEATVGRRRER